MIKRFLTLTALAFTLLVVGPVHQVQAGTDLSVSCNTEGPCTLSPAVTPLFGESNMVPGDSFVQTITVTNNDNDDTCNLGLTIPEYSAPDSQSVTLEDQMFTALTNNGSTVVGSLSGDQAVAGSTLADMYAAYASTPVSLGTVAPGATVPVKWYATFNPDAGNEYQGAQTTFDFDMSFTCTGGSSGSSGSSSGSSGSSSGSSDGGGSASPQVCAAATPGTISNFRIVSTGTNTVSLAWNPASQATHYALIFTRNSDGEQYGSPNIGNTTSYTVTNLSGGESYTFEIFAVNDCQPGERASVSTGTIAGGTTTGRPIGGDGQVLGTDTESESEEESAEEEETSEESGEESADGQVAGIIDEIGQCVPWRIWLPLIFLVIQVVFAGAVELLFRKDEGWTKYFLLIGGLLASIALFYLLRECACGTNLFWLTWICKWYWLVASLVAVVLRGVGYAFVEEVDTKKPVETPAD